MPTTFLAILGAALAWILVLGLGVASGYGGAFAYRRFGDSNALVARVQGMLRKGSPSLEDQVREHLADQEDDEGFEAAGDEAGVPEAAEDEVDWNAPAPDPAATPEPGVAAAATTARQATTQVAYSIDDHDYWVSGEIISEPEPGFDDGAAEVHPVAEAEGGWWNGEPGTAEDADVYAAVAARSSDDQVADEWIVEEDDDSNEEPAHDDSLPWADEPSDRTDEVDPAREEPPGAVAGAPTWDDEEGSASEAEANDESTEADDDPEWLAGDAEDWGPSPRAGDEDESESIKDEVAPIPESDRRSFGPEREPIAGLAEAYQDHEETPLDDRGVRVIKVEAPVPQSPDDEDAPAMVVDDSGAEADEEPALVSEEEETETPPDEEPGASGPPRRLWPEGAHEEGPRIAEARAADRADTTGRRDPNLEIALRGGAARPDIGRHPNEPLAADDDAIELEDGRKVHAIGEPASSWLAGHGDEDENHTEISDESDGPTPTEDPIVTSSREAPAEGSRVVPVFSDDVPEVVRRAPEPTDSASAAAEETSTEEVSREEPDDQAEATDEIEVPPQVDVDDAVDALLSGRKRGFSIPEPPTFKRARPRTMDEPKSDDGADESDAMPTEAPESETDAGADTEDEEIIAASSATAELEEVAEAETASVHPNEVDAGDAPPRDVEQAADSAPSWMDEGEDGGDDADWLDADDESASNESTAMGDVPAPDEEGFVSDHDESGSFVSEADESFDDWEEVGDEDVVAEPEPSAPAVPRASPRFRGAAPKAWRPPPRTREVPAAPTPPAAPDAVAPTQPRADATQPDQGAPVVPSEEGSATSAEPPTPEAVPEVQSPEAAAPEPAAPERSSLPPVGAGSRSQLSRTEAIEELAALYGLTYDEGVALVEAGLWGFENHDEWVRAMRAGSKPAGVPEDALRKVLSTPMVELQPRLEKLREKRAWTTVFESSLWGVGADEASAMYDAGFTDLDKLRDASSEKLAKVPGIGSAKAFQIKASLHDLAPEAGAPAEDKEED